MSFTCGILSLIILLSITVSGSLGETLRVTCSPQTICALRESTVTLQCSHSNTNIRPQYSFWFSPKQKAKWRNEEDPEDLALDSDYAGRARYTTSPYKYSSTLTISDLRERDSGKYHLMIITETGQKYSSSTAVTLTVSDLQMKVISKTEQQMKLSCSTSCSLSSKPSDYNWYKNRQYQLSTYEHQKVLSVYSSAGPGSYSCSVSSHPEIRSNTVCEQKSLCFGGFISGLSLHLLISQ
ncbi:CD48 antigen-like [Colossoma macropomum]|uniref:CD48 antigen-like n=1 Tax=Colossoma macropomum TaxID=42526 RepID=UPI001864B298|nr:CD48 antigen-like [Colossoma macropomum]